MAESEENLGGYSKWQTRLIAIGILLVGLGIGYFVYSSEIDTKSRFPFRLGLDLTGGSHLVYRADVSDIPPEEVGESMEILRDVIERRVNLFGVSEPIVQVERSGILADVTGVTEGREERLIVELPGVTDVEEAIRLIGETPLLEFKLLDTNIEVSQASVDEEGNLVIDSAGQYVSTGLTGRFLKQAQLEFGTSHTGLSNEPVVAIEFNNEGAELFAEITRGHIGDVLAIFLDGEAISLPTIQQEIVGGQAIISGNFDPQEARDLVQNLNFGALPVPIELLSTQTIGSSLGDEAVERGIVAGIVGLLAVAIFLLIWYRFPGILAIISLAIYVAAMLAVFKLVPVVLTAAGVAGFILSIDMAVDANVLIFERIKDELKSGKGVHDAIKQGFSRAWNSIRDGNISSIITAIILFWLGTSIVEGFALTFGLGVIISMVTAITITRTILLAVAARENKGLARFLFGSGIRF